MTDRPAVTTDILAKWQRIVDLAARIADVPAGLIMRTTAPDHAVLVTSAGAANPYTAGMSFELNPDLYCHSVLESRAELVVRDALTELAWQNNQDLEHGMSFYIGYPIAWPDGVLFGTMCVLDRGPNDTALRCRDLLLELRLLIEGDLALLAEVARRRRLEQDLQQHLETLEQRVGERTRALLELNECLTAEIAQRRAAERILQLRERELEETNTALRVLFGKIERARSEHEEQILQQLQTLVVPHIDKLRACRGRSPDYAIHLDMLESSLGTITSSFSTRLMAAFEQLTPTEIEIAQMIVAGKTSKTIAVALSRETSTIDFHRNNIRRKLHIDSRNQNLRSYLMSLG